MEYYTVPADQLDKWGAEVRGCYTWREFLKIVMAQNGSPCHRRSGVPPFSVFIATGRTHPPTPLTGEDLEKQSERVNSPESSFSRQS